MLAKDLSWLWELFIFTKCFDRANYNHGDDYHYHLELDTIQQMMARSTSYSFDNFGLIIHAQY
jgi:hypothetical protein